MSEPTDQKIKALLTELEPDVCLKDRQEAAKEFKLTPTAVKSYLNGKIENADIALDLLIFLNSRLIHRQIPTKA